MMLSIIDAQRPGASLVANSSKRRTDRHGEHSIAKHLRDPVSLVHSYWFTALTLAPVYGPARTPSHTADAIAWGALGRMFSLHATYHMVPVSLAIGFFLPLPLYLLHRLWPKAGFQNFNACIIMGVGVRVVFRLPVRRDQHAGEHEDRDLLAVVGAHALPAFVHQEQLHRRGGDGRRDAGGAVHPQLCAPCPPDVALRGI
ncbi:hypothetical protein AcV5_002622 [Taiwanofungus camphoratus]|nr:hypothetical protein AcV5_002622 [Antrodia cinnamomea]